MILYHEIIGFLKFWIRFLGMKPVLQYSDFRGFLRDFYLERKAHGFSFREFSKAAGYSSPVFLKLVIEGKANLSEAGTERVAQATGLAGMDAEYFRILVQMNQAKDSGRKKLLFGELRKIARENKVKVVGEDQYDYYESWVTPVLRELLPAMPNAKISEIASALQFKASTGEIRKSKATLLRGGFLAQGADGGFQQTDRRISTGNLELPSLAVRGMHRQMGELAVRALEEIPKDDRDISGLTLGVPESALPRIRAEIGEFRRKISAIATESPRTDRIYRLNVQFFPLTRNLEKSASEEDER